jgi:hypothetical protein
MDRYIQQSGILAGSSSRWARRTTCSASLNLVWFYSTRAKAKAQLRDWLRENGDGLDQLPLRKSALVRLEGSACPRDQTALNDGYVAQDWACGKIATADGSWGIDPRGRSIKG